MDKVIKENVRLKDLVWKVFDFLKLVVGVVVGYVILISWGLENYYYFWYVLIEEMF